jgi:hypothetical protein
VLNNGDSIRSISIIVHHKHQKHNTTVRTQRLP